MAKKKKSKKSSKKAKDKGFEIDLTMPFEMNDKSLLYVLGFALILANVSNTYFMLQVNRNVQALGQTIMSLEGTVPQAATQGADDQGAGSQGQAEANVVTLKVLNDGDCSICDPSGIIQSLDEQIFTGSDEMEVETIDYQTSEGQQLAEQLGVEALPAYAFDGSVVDSEGYAQIQGYLDEKGGLYLLRAGGNYLINEPATEKPTVELFVMSQCPYGTMAEDNFEEVLNNFGDALDFKLQFIASKTGDGFSSLHGQPEVDENMRQVCAMEHYPGKYYDYIICRNKNITSEEWESCATQAGMDSSVIQTCFSGEEGSDLLEENIQRAQELGIGSSPTFIINGQYKVGGALPAESIKQTICEINEGLEGCSNTLTQDSSAPSGGCG